MNSRWRWLALVLTLLVGLGAVPQPQESVTYERYDVAIDVQPDGSLLVAETYQIRFEGEFHTGFAEIPLDYVTDVVDVQVREGDKVYTEGGYGAGTFDVDREWDTIYVEWEYEPTSGVEVRIFTVEYRVLGGLWVYPEWDSLAWIAVPEDRSGIPVEASRVTVRLPRPLSPVDLQFHSFDQETHKVLDGRTIVFEASSVPIPDGTSLQVMISFPHGLTTATAPEWQRTIDEENLAYRWEELNVDVTIAPDGVLAVEETHTLTVNEGYLYHGYREISRLYLDQITGAGIREGEQTFELSNEPCDYCYVVEHEYRGKWVWVTSYGELIVDEEEAGSTLLEWAFPAVGGGATATFRLNYTVLGAVRVLTDAQEIAWTVVFAGRDVPVEAASLWIHLPPGVSAGDVIVNGGATAVQPDGTLRVIHDEPVPAGEAWPVRIRLPAGATQAEKPGWQHELEEALAEQQAYLEAERQATIRRARWQLALGSLGCLFSLLGLGGVLVAWYVWGRDLPAPVVAQYVTEPPSDLPPGIVAYLVDEKPTVKGVLADLLHLATLGLISVDLQKPDFTVTLNWGQEIGKDKVARVAGGEEVTLAKHERTLFNTLLKAIKRTNQPTPFSDVHAFTHALPTIYTQMGEAATRYFSTLPDEARRRWNWAGQWLIIVAGVLAVAMLCVVASMGWAICAPSLGLAVAGLMLMGISRWMPQRTTLGVEEAARWRAFRRYLQSLKRYGDVEAAQRVLDRYFPYAVALNVEEVVLRQAEEMGAMAPVWMSPVAVEVGAAMAVTAGVERQRLRTRLSNVAQGLVPPQAKTGPPRAAKVRPALAERPAGVGLSLDGLSNNLSRSLDQASHSLSSLLNAAVGEVDASPFQVIVKGTGEATKLTWAAGASTMNVLGDILETSSSGGGGGGYSGGRSRKSKSSGSSFRSSSWSSSSSSSSSRSSSRSTSSSRRSSGGGRRGFR